jgi:putative transposase
MLKKRYSKSEILNILKKYEDGMTISSILKQYSISQATFYNWKAKYRKNTSINIEEIKKLREDNERLKQMYIDLSFENLSLKAKLEKSNSINSE